MEPYTQEIPIEVVCSLKALPCFLDYGFHEAEWQAAALYACASRTHARVIWIASQVWTKLA